VFFAELNLHAQDEVGWFELGTTWTYIHQYAFDPAQDNYIAEFEVTELTEFNGKECAKIESISGGLGCLSVQPPYYMYESNDSIFYCTGSMTQFELGLVMSGSESWEFNVVSEWSNAQFLVNVESFYSEMVLGIELDAVDLEYEPTGGGLSEIVPGNLSAIDYVGALRYFIIPFGNAGFCDGAYNIELCSFSSPSFSYQSPSQASCILSSIEEKNEVLRFYPNPAQDYLSWNEVIERINIFDLSGRLVLARSLAYSKRKMDVQFLPSGMYLLEAIDENGKSRKTKFLKN
jgi:hypothetical protein